MTYPGPTGGRGGRCALDEIQACIMSYKILFKEKVIKRSSRLTYICQQTYRWLHML